MTSEPETTFTRVRIYTGRSAGKQAWGAAIDDKFVGLYDDYGDKLHIGNGHWFPVSSNDSPAWL